MRRQLGRLLRRLGNEFDPPKERAIEGSPPVSTADKLRARQVDASFLVADARTVEYLVLVLRPRGEGQEIVVRGFVDEPHWPAFTETMSRIETSREEFSAGSPASD